ncbi:hypothetical protein [Nostoc sp. TCL240-02]|uniref:hypothetical protein n=1 Tax=Nostoc sp. TCL240-02 TaxID=2572090 RepID=UPI00157F9850|nr:hypothetical protein [Nostoc sp. TCL240-02]QKQ72048.1 hypothetical protein FBB35_00535 [Nostoc sp. TCL240-02]
MKLLDKCLTITTIQLWQLLMAWKLEAERVNIPLSVLYLIVPIYLIVRSEFLIFELIPRRLVVELAQYFCTYPALEV